MSSFPERNSVFCPVDYTADFVSEGIPKPRLLFTTVQGNPKPTNDPDKIVNRTWNFVGKALLLQPSDTNEVQQYRIKYDFTKVDVPVTATASGSLLGTMQINQQKNVYNANRYMTWTQDAENPRIVYIDMRIPSCLLKKNKRSVLDFSIVLNDNTEVKNECGLCTTKCRYIVAYKFSGKCTETANIKFCTSCKN